MTYIEETNAIYRALPDHTTASGVNELLDKFITLQHATYRYLEKYIESLKIENITQFSPTAHAVYHALLVKPPLFVANYNVGDYCYVIPKTGILGLSKGKIVAILNLPNYHFSHYVIEISVAYGPVMEVHKQADLRKCS